MIFQWQLFALIMMLAVLSPLVGWRQRVYGNRNQQYQYSWMAAGIMALPMIIMAGRRYITIPNFGDTLAYLTWFRNTPKSWEEVVALISEDSKDVGFTVCTFLIKKIIGDNELIYFLIIAIICISCVIYVFRKYSYNFWVTLFLFIASADYLQWNYNGIRQFIAVSIVFACIDLLVNKKYCVLIGIILLLSTIHATILLFIPVMFIVQGKAWNKKTLLFAVIIVAAIASVDRFTDLVTFFMENSQYSKEVNQYLNTDGTNVLRVLVFSIPAIMSLCFKSRIYKDDNKIINLATNMSIISALCYLLSAFTSGIFLGRIPIMFSLYNYILLPWIIERYFTKESVRIIYIMMISLYMVFYYYQTHIIWML